MAFVLVALFVAAGLLFAEQHFRLVSYDRYWDARLRELMAQSSLTDVGAISRLGEVEIWTSSYPYAFGTLCNGLDRDASGVPSYSVRRELRKRKLDAITRGAS